MGSFIDKRCPCCNTELLITDEVHVCDDCGAVYHKTCWEKSGGCLTPGCSERKDAQAEQENAVLRPIADGISAQILFCRRCHAPMKPEQKFCQRCGAPANVSAKTTFCAKCGSPMAGGERFCQKCGQPVGVSVTAAAAPARSGTAVKKSHKTAIIVSVIIAVVMLLLVGGGITAGVIITNHQHEVATQEYSSTAAKF